MDRLNAYRRVSFEAASKAENTQPKIADDKRLRFSQAKGLHAHSRFGVSVKDFLAKFRDPGALQSRAASRQAAVDNIRGELIERYGEATGHALFSKFMGSAPKSITQRQMEKLAQLEIDEVEAKRLSVSIDNVFGSLKETCGLTVDPARQAEIKGKMARAVIDLPEGSKKEESQKEDCVRAAMGAAISDDIVTRLLTFRREHPESKQPLQLTKGEIKTVDEVMDAFFSPAGAYRNVDPKTVHASLQDFFKAGRSPEKSGMLKGVLREEAIGLTSPKKGKLFFDFISENAGKGGNGITRSAAEEFLRDDPKLGDKGLGAYAIIKHLGGEHFAAPATAICKRLSAKPFEFRKEKLESLSLEASEQIAANSLVEFETAMSDLFGGKDEDAIKAKVDQLPQEFCDLLATAHSAIDKGAKINVVLTDDERKDASAKGQSEAERRMEIETKTIAELHDKLNAGFVALRVLNPALNESAGGNTELVGKTTNLGKLIQNVANRVPLGGSKESIHPSVKEDLTRSVNEWMDGYATFMRLATEKGKVLVGD